MPTGHPSRLDVDVAVVGGGVVGCSIAARVSQSDRSVALLEATEDVGTGTSSANSGVASTGWAMAEGSLEAKLIHASSPMWEELTERLQVPFRRCGRVILAVEEEETERVGPLLARAETNGVTAERLGPDEIVELAPYANPDAAGGIYLPDDAIVDPLRLTIAYAELAAENGASIQRRAPLVHAQATAGGRTELITPVQTLRARFVVNAAGLGADEVSRLLGAEELGVTPRRGEWLLLDREFGRGVSMILSQLPSARTHGMMILPTPHGSVLVGPTAEDIEDARDRSTNRESLRRVAETCRRLMPGIDERWVTKSFAGLRAHASPTYLVARSERAANVVQAIGIRSSGISSAPAMGEYVFGLLQEAGLEASDRLDRLTRLEHAGHYRDAIDAGWDDSDPPSCTVICACEKVTARELHQAFSSSVPATSISGAGRRTHATWGRCQGSACLSGVCMIASQYLDCEGWQIPLREPASTIGVAVANRV
jgi:glycerol-3-phosphate dehydrogenase